MTSPHGALFWGSRCKLQRAKNLVQEFVSAVERHFAENPPDIRVSAAPKINPNAPLPEQISIAAHVKLLPRETGAIVGDVIHNLRAALDIMAVDLVRAANGNTNGVYFPFCDTAADLPDMIKRRNFHRAGPNAETLLKQFAPYRGGSADLRGLHELDIEDKHHAIIPAITIATAGIYVLETSDGRVEIGPTTSPVAVVFPEGGAFAGAPIVATLEHLIQVVEGVIETFATGVASGKP